MFADETCMFFVREGLSDSRVRRTDGGGKVEGTLDEVSVTLVKQVGLSDSRCYSVHLEPQIRL